MIDWLKDNRVAVVKESTEYPKHPPYHPSEKYPEWNGFPVGEEDNPVYRSVRKLFRLLRYDIDNYNSPLWNPLGEIIRPGNRVVLKPNALLHINFGEKKDGFSDMEPLITHGSIIRALLDYSAKALAGRGKILIADCPLQGADWEELVRHLGLNEIKEYFQYHFPDIEICIHDHRLGKAIVKRGVVVERIIGKDKSDHYEEVDLGNASLLVPLMKSNFEFGVIQYPKYRMKMAHTPETNKFLISKDFLYADVFINLPKMKTHMKSGITGALKNLVGINGHKDYLPHFRFGSPKRSGDEYPDGNWYWDLVWWFIHKEWNLDRGNMKRVLHIISRFLCIFLPWFSRMPRETIFLLGGGSWHGNDTLWRTILDLNRAFFYFDRKRKMISTDSLGQVRYMAILDGIIAGQGEGPIAPKRCPYGVMMASANPLAMDAIATAMMGFDILKVKKISEGFRLKSFPLAEFSIDEIEIIGDLGVNSIDELYKNKAYVCFEPTYGFKGHIEHSNES